MSGERMVKIGTSWINPASVDAVYSDASQGEIRIVVLVRGVEIEAERLPWPQGDAEEAVNRVMGYLARNRP